MANTYLLPKARNIQTGQTVKEQDLSGNRFTHAQRFLCEEAAERLAQKMAARTGEGWVGFVEEYIPTERRG